VDVTSVSDRDSRYKGRMIEICLVALLLWLWVIERRLNTTAQELRGLKLDFDGLRAERTQAKSPPATGETSSLPLPEVTSIGRSSKARVH
jgi:hypothetical protein